MDIGDMNFVHPPWVSSLAASPHFSINVQYLYTVFITIFMTYSWQQCEFGPMQGSGPLTHPFFPGVLHKPSHQLLLRDWLTHNLFPAGYLRPAGRPCRNLQSGCCSSHPAINSPVSSLGGWRGPNKMWTGHWENYTYALTASHGPTEPTVASWEIKS